MYDLKLKEKYYDIIIGVLSIHHLTDTQKKNIFKKIFQSSKSHGLFIVCDIIKFPTKKESNEKEKLWLGHLMKNFNKDEAEYWFDNSHEEDIPATVPDQLKWMKLAGFSKQECIYWYMNYSIIVATK